MELDKVLAELGLAADAEVLAEGWAASQATLPAELPFFLEPGFVADACRDAALPDAMAAGVRRAAHDVAADVALRALLWHFHRCFYHAPDYPRALIPRWPLLTDLLRDGGDVYLLVLLSNMGELRRLYRAHAISPDVAHATLEDIQRWYVPREPGRQTWGLEPRRLGWLRNHLTGGIYHLGRLQFQPGAYRNGARFYRQRGSGRVLALSEDGLRYRADGQRDGAGGLVDEVGGWTARLIDTEEAVEGVPLSPRGYAIRQPVRLPHGDWRPALVPGDPVLHLHIPAGSPMDFEQCGRSLQAALDFFPRHFPDQPFRAFTCNSWLLDAQFECLLSPSSNIVRFLQEMYLLPIPSNGRSVVERVFGEGPFDLAQAPRDTTLRRAVVDHLQAGGHFRGGASVLFPEDLHWGEQVYRRGEAEASVGVGGRPRR